MAMIELPPVQKIVRALQVEVNQLGSSGNPPTENPNAAEKGNSSVNAANIDIICRSLPLLFIRALMVLGTIRRSVGVQRHGPQCGNRGKCAGYTLVCRCTDGSTSSGCGWVNLMVDVADFVIITTASRIEVLGHVSCGCAESKDG